MTNWTPQLDEASGARYLAIADALARDISGGKLKAGDRLPTHRDLAWHLGVTVGTVSRAYAEAERRGLTSGEVGRGTFVNAPHSNEQLHRWNDAAPGAIQLRSSFPIPCPEESALAELMARCAAGPRAMEMMSYQPQRGLAEHREAGAAWITRNGYEVSAEQVTLSAGAHHGVLVVLAAVTRPGSSTLMLQWKVTISGRVFVLLRFNSGYLYFGNSLNVDQLYAVNGQYCLQ